MNINTGLKISCYDYVEKTQAYEVIAERDGLTLMFAVSNDYKLVKDDNGFEQWIEVDTDNCEVKTFIITEDEVSIQISSFLSGYVDDDLLPYMIKEVLAYVANLVLEEYNEQQRMKYSPYNRD